VEVQEAVKIVVVEIVVGTLLKAVNPDLRPLEKTTKVLEMKTRRKRESTLLLMVRHPKVKTVVVVDVAVAVATEDLASDVIPTHHHVNHNKITKLLLQAVKVSADNVLQESPGRKEKTLMARTAKPMANPSQLSKSSRARNLQLHSEVATRPVDHMVKIAVAITEMVRPESRASRDLPVVARVVDTPQETTRCIKMVTRDPQDPIDLIDRDTARTIPGQGVIRVIAETVNSEETVATADPGQGVIRVIA